MQALSRRAFAEQASHAPRSGEIMELNTLYPASKRVRRNPEQYVSDIGGLARSFAKITPDKHCSTHERFAHVATRRYCPYGRTLTARRRTSHINYEAAEAAPEKLSPRALTVSLRLVLTVSSTFVTLTRRSSSPSLLSRKPQVVFLKHVGIGACSTKERLST